MLMQLSIVSYDLSKMNTYLIYTNSIWEVDIYNTSYLITIITILFCPSKIFLKITVAIIHSCLDYYIKP